MYVKCVCHNVLHLFENEVNDAILKIRSSYRIEDRHPVILDVKYAINNDYMYAFIEWDYEEEVSYD